MKKKFKKLVLIFTLILSSCVYKLDKNIINNKTLNYIYLKSYNLNNYLTKEIKKEIKLHNIIIEENYNKFNKKNNLLLIIKKPKIEKEYKIYSILKEKENIENNYIFIFKIKICIPNKKQYNFLIKLNKIFFEDPSLILQKKLEKKNLFKDVYKEVAKIIYEKILEVCIYNNI